MDFIISICVMSSVYQVWFWSQWRLPDRGGALLGRSWHQQGDAGLVWHSYVQPRKYISVLSLYKIIIICHVFRCLSSCDRCRTGQRSRRRPVTRGHGPGDAFPTRHLRWLHQVKNKACLLISIKRKIHGPLSDLLALLYFSLPVFLPCSGFATLTRGHIVLQRDFTPSLALSTLLW